VIPPWWDGSVIYQVYPRAFADGNGDGAGDLPGVLARLDHLTGQADSVGVDAVWISPFYPHGGVDGGYDITDHTAIAPEFGSLADFDRLLAACHARGLRVLLDLVPGHTSDRHRWFASARASRTSSQRDWYLWADPAPGGGPPNNWIAEFGGSAWTWVETTGQFFHHSFYPEQPDLNWRNPAVRDAMADVMRFWLDRGVDGFRVDAIQSLIKDRRLRDNPPAGRPRAPWPPEPGGLRRRWSRDRPEVSGILRDLRRIADGYDDRILVGELYAPADRLGAALGGARRDGLHLALDHQLARSAWDAAAFRRALAAAERHVTPPRSVSWAFSNHDLSRHATRWGREQSRLAALILLTLRGTICLYQGEEVGMTDVAPPPDSVLDRAGRDPSRSPFDWGAAARQRDDPDSILSLYRELLDLRRRSTAIRRGTLTLLRGLPSGVLGYERMNAGERVTVLANMGDQSTTIRLAADIPTRPLLTTGPGQAEFAAGRLALAAGAGVVLGGR
jgi:alpha-glucosidase